MIAIAGFLGNLQIGKEFVAELQKILPEGVMNGLLPRFDEILSGPPQGILTLAIIGTIWTASSIFEGLRTSLNRAHNVQNPPNYIFRRLKSFLEFIVTTIVIMLITFFLTVAPEIFTIFGKKLAEIGRFDSAYLENFENLRFNFTIVIVFLMLLASYKLIPNIDLSLKDIFPGSLTVMFLWVASSYGYSYYLASFHQVSLVYGSLAGIIATLLYFYIMAFIYIFGAEVNYFWGREA